MAKNNELNHTFLEAIKFGLVGISNTAITFIVYSILVYLNIQYALANLCGYALAMINSYLLNSKYVFKQKQTKQNISKFILVNIVMYGISTLLLFIFIDILYMNDYLAQGMSIVICTAINFLFTKFWTFK